MASEGAVVYYSVTERIHAGSEKIPRSGYQKFLEFQISHWLRQLGADD